MESPLKVATPFTAATVAEPASEPEPGFEAMARVTGAEEEVTVFPWASWMVTTGWVANAEAAEAPTGWVEKTSLVAAPVEMMKLEEVVEARPAEAAERV
jgi:hypothetical protein